MESKAISEGRTVGRPVGHSPARGAILAAAERAFAERGLAGARTVSIASEAGVNHALVFYYFGNKESLYEAVMEDHFAGFNEQALEVLADPGPPGEVLLRYIGLHFDFVSRQQRNSQLFHQSLCARGAMMERLVRKYFLPRNQAFVRLLQRGMKAGEFRRGDAQQTAISIVALIVFYFSAAPVIQMIGLKGAFTEATLKRRKEEVLDFVRHGLFSDSISKP